MTADRRDLPMPLYTMPSVAPAVMSVAPTAVHTFSLLGSVAYAPQAPAGAFITYTSHGPAVAFPIISAYPGWGSVLVEIRASALRC